MAGRRTRRLRTISETVLAHHAIKGNVEAELASEDETAGCGCAYPDYIDDDVVDRSNQIITRLRATAGQFPHLVGRLGELPRHLTASVGGERVGILHGDPEYPDHPPYPMIVTNRGGGPAVGAGLAGQGPISNDCFGAV